MRKPGSSTTWASRSLSSARARSSVPMTNSPPGTGTISPSTGAPLGSSMREHLAVGLLEKPQLLVVPDVAVVPDQGAHRRIVLQGQVFIGDRPEQKPRPLPRFLQLPGNDVLG